MADTAYCVKCKEKREMKDTDTKHITMKNGKPALQAPCPVCGTTLTRILPTKAQS